MGSFRWIKLCAWFFFNCFISPLFMWITGWTSSITWSKIMAFQSSSFGRDKRFITL